MSRNVRSQGMRTVTVAVPLRVPQRMMKEDTWRTYQRQPAAPISHNQTTSEP